MDLVVKEEEFRVRTRMDKRTDDKRDRECLIVENSALKPAKPVTPAACGVDGALPHAD
jgi:hypothetical protein